VRKEVRISLESDEEEKLTRSENNQLGFAIPGTSGKKKYAKPAIGREMTPLITTSPH